MATRSMLAAVSGINATQEYLDEIGSNIANANTVGYKQGEVQFADLLAEQLAGATAPTTGTGGVNPVAIGSGVRVVAVSTDLAEGTLESTGVATDVAITGNGYLVVEQNGQQYFTRDGALTVDANGNLTTLGGAKVLGWQANVTGALNINAPVAPITIPEGATTAAAATSTISLTGNLPAWSGGTATVPSYTITVDAYDPLGKVVPIQVTLTGAATANKWNLTAVAQTPSTGHAVTLFTHTTPPTLLFGPNGQLEKVNGNGPGATGWKLPVTTKPTGFTSLTLHFPSATSSKGMTQYAGPETVQMSQNGRASGSLVSYSIGGNGVITGTFSNGQSAPLAQIALASFTNPGGLQDVGGNLLSTSANSGPAAIGAPGTGVRGTLLGGELEQSNVNLATQLTDLITAQQAYQANTKVISTDQQVITALEQA